MLPPRAVAAVLAVSLLTPSAPDLQVLSFSPTGEASLTAPIQVIFDRPVAGSLDRSVDPAAIFSIEPATPGRVEWRDPVTLRFRPAAPLVPGRSYTVRVGTGFTAMDGSRLREPLTYSFTVLGPALLAGQPVSESEHPAWLRTEATFDVVFSAPVDSTLFRGLAYLDFPASCAAAGIIRLRVTGSRPIGRDDTWQVREAGGWERDRGLDSLRRVLTLTPERALPLNCEGQLVAPTVIDPEGTRPFARWAFRTYGPFRLNGADCSAGPACPTGGIRLTFSTPVRGSEVARHVRLLPPAEFTLSDTTSESDRWYLEAELTPNTGYAAVADSALRDVFGQRLTGNPAAGLRTTGYAPAVDHEYGRLTVERDAFRTLAVRHVNVDTLLVTIAPVPDSLIPAMLRYSRWDRDDQALAAALKDAVITRVPVPGPRDRSRIFGLKLPLYNQARAGMPLLQLVRVTSPQLPENWQRNQPFAVVQVTDLAVHARIGVAGGVAWVTGVGDGKPRAGATVTLFDEHGAAQATGRTGADGLARLDRTRPDSGTEEYGSFQGYVVASLGNDRALTAISAYDPDLSPWQFNVRAAYGDERYPVAGAVFTERGIYRPGEPVYAKAIVRSGPLGQLRPPEASDSIHWVFEDREGGVLREARVAPSEFGTSDQNIELPADLPLGNYQVRIEQRRGGRWLRLASAGYRVAEYRPPEFLVDAVPDSGARFPGDTVVTRVEARYLFGAPMARAALTWTARQSLLDFWELEIPNTDGFYLGDRGWWWEDYQDNRAVETIGQGSDTLDAAGRTRLTVPVSGTVRGRPARTVIEVSVTDVNRQTVGAQAAVLVHPASLYIGAKPLGASYFWTAGRAESVGLIGVTPEGRRLAGVAVHGTIVRREWHRVHRTRGGYGEVYGEWVSDTVASCDLTTLADTPAPCRFTPPSGGSYILTFTATDSAGRTASTSFYRWATGTGFVPWDDESQFKMDVVPDRERYSVGDTATVLFAAPFVDAEAWVTVEREGVIEQRRLKVTSGATTLKFPVTEAWAPNAFVSIVVARGRSAKPGPVDDPGRPTIRVGYAELRVTPEVKRLKVSVQPSQPEYRPGDTARVQLRVSDRVGRGQTSEVTLWAVDEGVLSLTGYQTPDPIDLLYAPRGLGLKLASNLTTVAPQVPEGEKGGRSPGGGGGPGEGEVMRSRFKTTAFFLGSVVTGPDGVVEARARLPDNLTTFRVMAVAVTAGDRYGKGQSPMLVTRPLLARPALPRFVRSGDRFTAGVVVNQRAGGTPQVTVRAEARGTTLTGKSTRTATLEAGKGREVRFDFLQPGSSPLGLADSAVFRFRVSGAGAEDGVEKRLAVQPAYRPRAWTVAGVLIDTATVEFMMPDPVDQDRSRLELTLGSSPLAVIKGASADLRIYPYYCSEQVSSTAQPLIALYQAQQARPGAVMLQGDPRREIETAVQMLSRRQRADGGIGYWDSGDWTTPWLSAFAGLTLLDARDAGVAVSDSVLARLARYLRGTLDDPAPIRAPVFAWYAQGQMLLSDQVAAADYLSRLGQAHVAAENELLRNVPQLAWEDRVRLAELLARRRAIKAARGLLEPAWAATRVEGRRAIVPDSGRNEGYHYFVSRMRPASRLLRATLAVDSTHRLIGPLVETLVQQGRAGMLNWWNTQDYAAAVSALAAFDRRMRSGVARGFAITGAGRTVFTVPGGAPGGLAVRDSSVPLTGLVTEAGGGRSRVRLSLSGREAGIPIYFYLTVREVPRTRPVKPEDQGIKVERWYERYDRDEPIISVAEGELVRVRLRVTIPEDRQFLVVDDGLPAGLEAIDLSLRTASLSPGPGVGQTTRYLAPQDAESEGGEGSQDRWFYGRWDSGWWSPFDHRELHDERVVYSATVLWRGTYTMTYLARATTPGTFIRPPAHAEEMYNPAVYGRSDGGIFTVTPR